MARSPDSSFDAWLDAQLSGVTPPGGLRRRLARIGSWDDANLDRALADVPSPEGLVRRLAGIPTWTDEHLDRALCDVTVPAGLRQRLARLVRPRPIAWRRMAAAAAMFVVVGAWCGSILGSLLLGTYPPAEGRPVLLSSVEFSPSQLDPRQLDLPTVVIEPSVSAVAAAPPVERLDAGFARAMAVFDDPFAAPAALPRPESLAPAKLSIDVTMVQIAAMAADTTIDQWQNLRLMAASSPRGLEISSDVVQRFRLQNGFWVPVEPKYHPTIEIPLVTDVASFELARNYLDEGRRPPPESVRTEEFLAAVAGPFVPPTDRRLAIFAAGAPAPWRPSAAAQRSAAPYLLELGVQARLLPKLVRRPRHLTLAVDVSGSMQIGNRLPMLRRALGQVVAELEPLDRVSLVAFDGDAKVLVEHAGPDEDQALRQAIAALSVSEATNVAAGLLTACAVASRDPAPIGAIRRVVLLTDGMSEVPPESAEAIERFLGSPAFQGLGLEIVEVNHEPATDPRLERLARAGGGQVRRAAHAAQIGCALREVLSGQSQVVAADVKLIVDFSTTAVQGYRLCGHEPASGVDLYPGRLEMSLHSGEAAHVLFELALAPGNWTELATARVQWRDPRAGTVRTTGPFRVTRAHLSSSFESAPASLQAATVAAGAAEALRNAQYVQVADLLSLAQRVSPSWPREAAWGDLVELVERLAALPPGSPRRGPGRPRQP